MINRNSFEQRNNEISDKQFLRLKIDSLKILSRSFFCPRLIQEKKKTRISSLEFSLKTILEKFRALSWPHPADKNEHGVKWNQVRPFIKFPKCAQYPDSERVETRALSPWLKRPGG